MSATDRIDPNRLNEIFTDSLFRQEELAADGSPPANVVKIEGIIADYGFHPDRLAGHAGEIRQLLAALPDEFHVTGGGGMSFLNACMDRSGRQWGEHRNVEQLFVLGMGIGAVTCPLPRDLWVALPGGMPYYCVNCEAGASAGEAAC